MSALEEYIQSYHNNFWHFEEGGNVIAIPDGDTIGYSDYLLQEIIFYLAPHGLPRLGSLLLVIAATNSQGQNSIEEITKVVKRQFSNDEDVDQGILFLKVLSQLPARYKKGILRLEVLRGVFQLSHNSIGKKRSLGILSELKNNSSINNYSKALEKSSLSRTNLNNDFRTLSIIGRKLDSVETVMERLTLLPKIENELNELDTKTDKDLDEDIIEQLKKNSKSYYVATLVSRLISGLHIPFHSTLPSNQALGGVADITNKGSFDKLLMSEFAFDDQILMSRLANSESLYHHREVPPADNNYSRVILIDISLKNWGTIKTISFAIMLAIANHPKSKNPCNVFLVGKSYKEISIETVDEIIDGLQVLDSSLDPGVGLMGLFSGEEIKRSEIFFISSKESLDAPVMKRFNAALGKRIDHWIHPNEEGEIEVYKNPKRGKRFIQKLKIPLRNIWVKPQKDANETIIHAADYQYPILFPENKYKVEWYGGSYFYFATKSRGIFRSYREEVSDFKGWELVTTNFLPTDTLKAVITHEDLSVTVLTVEKNNQFVLKNFPSGDRIPLSYNKHIRLARAYSVEGDQFKCSSSFKTVFIDLEGNVSEYDPPVEEKIDKKLGRFHLDVYQNLKQISIVHGGLLKFGKHELVFKNKGLFLTHNENKKTISVQASEESSGKFSFHDGSTIHHNRNGMLLLKSSNHLIPNIYIPTALNSPLGMATEDTFAGNAYYQMNRKIEIKVSSRPTYEVIKIVGDRIGEKDLRIVREMIINGVIVVDNEKEMNLLKVELDRMNEDFFVRKRGKEQQVIEVVDFYEIYIKKFINHILSHGAVTQ